MQGGKWRNGTGTGCGWLRKKKRYMLIKKCIRKGRHPDTGRKILETGEERKMKNLRRKPLGLGNKYRKH